MKKNKITIQTIEQQVIEETKGKSTEYYLSVFNGLSEEEKLNRYRFFIECLDFPNQDAYLKTSGEYADFIYQVITDGIPVDKVEPKDKNNWQDLRVGRLTVSSYKYLSLNLWMIHSTQLLKCKNCKLKDLLVSVNLREVAIKFDGVPYDAYIEFVLKSFKDKNKVASYVKKFQSAFIDKAGYQYLYRLNEKLGREEGNYVDYKDIRVCDYIYNKESNLVMVKIGVKPDYVPQEEDKPVKKRKAEDSEEELEELEIDA